MEDSEFEPFKTPIFLEENVLLPDQSLTMHLKSLVDHLNKSGLYKWAENEFPLKPPPSVFWGPEFAGKWLIDFDQLFKSPDPNELELLARGNDDNLRKLTPEMLEQVRTEGVIKVPSIAFPGQTHVWKISALLQTGRKNITYAFQKGMALSLDALLWHFTRRLWGEKFSVLEGLKELGQSIKRFFHPHR